MIAEVCDVARKLGVTVSPADLVRTQAMRRLVDLARQYGNDCGLAVLAGVWLADGVPEHEIVARLWPQHRARLKVVR